MRRPRVLSESGPVTPSLHRRAITYVQERGFLDFVRMVFHTYVFSRSLLYIYVCSHTVSTEGDPHPSVANFEAAFVSSNEEADGLARTHEDFRLLDRTASKGLDCGAVALCLYSGNRLTNVSWLTTTEVARRAIGYAGFAVDPEIHGAWTGRVRTQPSYEGKGLFRYACMKRFEYLLSLGIEKSCVAVARTNTHSHVMAASLGCRIVGKGHLVRLLWWQWWRSDQLTRADEKAVRQMVADALASRPGQP